MKTPRLPHITIQLMIIFIASGVAVSPSASAQTLTQKLQEESAGKLAKDALEKGDAIRGAVLFPQQKLACVSCHSPGATDLLGPDLTRLPKDVSDQHLVESILNPSKTIRKGFETTSVVTAAGKTFSGRIISQTDSPKKIVLRDSSGDRRLLTFTGDDIDEVSVSTKSTMPDRLADQLKDRQQFLDLVRYMIELRDSAKDTQQTVNRPASVELVDLDPQLHGLVLLNEYKCQACHTNDQIQAAAPLRHAPNLGWLAGRTDASYIEKMILDPHATKPGSKMPRMLAGIDDEERKLAAKQLTHFIFSLRESDKSNDSPAGIEVKEGATGRGKELFHSIGCVACHSPRDEKGVELLAEESVSLVTVRDKFRFLGLIEFLENPHTSRPDGRMPNMKLSRWEAIDLASYLLKGSETANISAFKADRELAAAGRKRFVELKCHLCHTKTAELINAPKPTETVAKVVSKLRPEHGCLSTDEGEWPKYRFETNEAAHLRLALKRADPLSVENKIQVSLSTFRCDNCHQRGELGGVPDDRNHLFQTTNPNLGPQGRIPPDLTGVGAKLQPKWMRKILVSGQSSRPYMKTRMPQHGADNVGHLVELFQQVDKLPAVNLPEIKGRDQQKKYREAGLAIAGTTGLNCIACHTFQEKPAATMPALDLTEMTERLKPDWFYHYMLDPQRFNRGTVMPTFWPGGRSTRKNILDGKPDHQIAGLLEYLSDGRQARAPRGLIREPIELLATDEAVMLRRSWPGIGKRGIGVGYPGLVNQAFDAEQMRIAILWRGKFADPGGVWRSQGHGVAHPLSREQTKFLPGPEFDDANSPWVADEGRPPKHSFKGYELDELRRPKFLYEFDGIPVEDFAVDVKDSDSQFFIRRILTFKPKTSRANLMFRIATKDDVTKIGDEFQIGKSLLLKIAQPFAGEIKRIEAGSELRIPFDLTPATKQLVLEYRWK